MVVTTHHEEEFDGVDFIKVGPLPGVVSFKAYCDCGGELYVSDTSPTKYLHCRECGKTVEWDVTFSEIDEETFQEDKKTTRALAKHAFDFTDSDSDD